MRRIKLVFGVLVLMAVALVAFSGPAMADDFRRFDDFGRLGVCDEFGNNRDVCRDFEPVAFSDPFGFDLFDGSTDLVEVVDGHVFFNPRFF
jgi:hypothetical protein